MEFWGVEVKAKESCPVEVEMGSIIHLSQATVADIKKVTETVIIHVEVDGKKLVLGMLSQKTPQMSFDLVFDEDFVISHNLKNGSIHLMGYVAETENSEMQMYTSEEEEEDVPVAKENGQLAVKPKQDHKPKALEREGTEDDDSDDSSEESDDSEDDSDEEMATADTDSDEDSDEDDSEESEEEKPVKAAESGKKRSAADVKTPQPKKTKIATPQKTDGKKGVVHPATPHPNKKSEKTPKSGGEKALKSDAKTPKSGGAKSPKSGGSGSDLSCGPCKRTFKSDSAFQAHSKAKHAK